MPATEEPTVAMVEAAYRHHGIQAPHYQLRAAAGLFGDAARGRRDGWGSTARSPTNGFVKPNTGGALAVVAWAMTRTDATGPLADLSDDPP
jgi:hypothetical protein